MCCFQKKILVQTITHRKIGFRNKCTIEDIILCILFYAGKKCRSLKCEQSAPERLKQHCNK